jgi:hypothetical protein
VVNVLVSKTRLTRVCHYPTGTVRDKLELKFQVFDALSRVLAARAASKPLEGEERSTCLKARKPRINVELTNDQLTNLMKLNIIIFNFRLAALGTYRWQPFLSKPWASGKSFICLLTRHFYMPCRFELTKTETFLSTLIKQTLTKKISISDCLFARKSRQKLCIINIS